MRLLRLDQCPFCRGFIIGKYLTIGLGMAIIYNNGFGNKKAEDQTPAQENNGEKPSSNDQPGKAVEGLYAQSAKVVETKAG